MNIALVTRRAMFCLVALLALAVGILNPASGLGVADQGLDSSASVLLFPGTTAALQPTSGYDARGVAPIYAEVADQE